MTAVYDVLTAEDVTLTEVQELFEANRYWDPYGDCWTIGYGTTSGAGVVNPIPLTCTQPQAVGWLLEYMNRDVVPSILEVFKPENGNELGGLADIGYNCGAGVFREEPMYSALRSGSREEIAVAFMAFDHDANGGVLPDLFRRREDDRDLFLKVPPAPIPPKPAPSFHYAWYPAGECREDAIRYDVLSRIKNPDAQQREWLESRKAGCAKFATSVAHKADSQRLKNGKPSWSVDHRGFLYNRSHERAEGQIVVAS